MSKECNVSELQNKLVRCRYCNEEIELGVLPLHEYLCKTAKDKESNRQQETHNVYITKTNYH